MKRYFIDAPQNQGMWVNLEHVQVISAFFEYTDPQPVALLCRAGFSIRLIGIQEPIFFRLRDLSNAKAADPTEIHKLKVVHTLLVEAWCAQ